MKALIPQGLTGRPNCFGLLNNLMTLIICESLREIGEMACVTYAWSSRGQTLNLSSDDPACTTLRYLCITYKYLKVLIFCLRTAGPSFEEDMNLTPNGD